MDELLEVVDDGVQHLGRSFVSSVQVAPSKRASVVPINDSIWVEHGHHFEDEVFSQSLSLRVIGVCEEVEDSLHHPTSYTLPWVHSGTDDSSFLFLNITFRCNCDIITLVSSQSGAKSSDHTKFRFLGISLYSLEIVLKICKSVWVAIRKVNIIITVFKLIGKG